MKLIIGLLKAGSVVAAAILLLSFLAIYFPDLGIAAAIGIGSLGLIKLKWPISLIWLDDKIASYFIIIVAVVALIASAITMDALWISRWQEGPIAVAVFPA